MKVIFDPSNHIPEIMQCRCGCVFLTEEKDYHKETYSDETIYEVTCPCCGKVKEIARYKVFYK